MGAIRDMWLKWKMLRLPWRKRFLVGLDLNGNTFWEFVDPLAPRTSSTNAPVSSRRMRRMVVARSRAQRSLSGLSDLEISPQWHQWLRHTRPIAPTIQEQQAEVLRIEQLKYNAKLADQRWEAKAKYIESPKKQEKAQQPMLASDTVAIAGKKDVVDDKAEGFPTPKVMDPIEDPWEKAKAKQTGQKPGEGYQPEGWSPAAKQMRKRGGGGL